MTAATKTNGDADGHGNIHVPVPRHLAIILDGNRRWAAVHGLGPVDGHREGARRLLEAVEWSDEAGIATLTLWVLSEDNLGRPADEVAGLLPLIGAVLDDLAAKRRWRIKHLGRSEILPDCLQDKLSRAQAITRDINGMTVNMAVGYDGRQEIADAVCAAVNQTDNLDTIDWQRLIAGNLYTAGQPDPDLILRTSGERRLSGFMLWQAAKAEFHFCDTYWPAFSRADFDTALASYTVRRRRFGR